MVNNFRYNKLIWFVVFIGALIASIAGVLDTGIYAKVVSKEILPGAYSQDLITVVSSILAIVLLIPTKEKHVKRQIIILGLLGYLFYGYGIYVIERAYNLYYLLYMAIYTLSFWAIVYGLASLKKEVLARAVLPKKLKNISAGGALLQPIIFYPLWISMLVPLMQTGNQIDQLYSIFILDLCFIMPAFAILAYYTFRNKAIGLVLLPAVYLFGFVLIFSLALGELVKPNFGLPIKYDSLWQSLILSLFFLILGTIHLWKLKFGSKRNNELSNEEEVRI